MNADAIRASLQCGRRGCPCRLPRGPLHCPAHDDRRPSLSIRDDGDRLLWFCHAGCSQQEVLEALRERGLLNGLAASPETRYDIRDESGRPIATHIRTDVPGGKRFRWEREGRPGLNGLPVADLPFFGSEQLAVAPNAPVVICEGEKAALAARQALGDGFVALGTVTGAAATPGDAALRPLLGREIVLWPDADGPGQQHMRRIAMALHRLGQPAERIRVATWPEAQPGDDAADALERHGPDAVRRLVTAARPWAPPVEPAGHGAAEPAAPAEPGGEPEHVPGFPLSVFPGPFRALVNEGSRAIGVPPDFLALPLLSTVGAAIGNRVRLVLKPGWEVLPILWTTFIAHPGSGKTPALLAATEPLGPVDRQRRERYARDLDDHEALPRHERGRVGKPAPAVAIASDFTLEFLAVALPASPGILVRVDELATWAASFTRYKQRGATDRAQWLSLWAGVPFVRDRLTSPSAVTPRPVVCLAGATQPDRIGAIVADDVAQDGLPDRFIIAWPPSEPAAWTEDGVRDETRHAVTAAIEQIAGTPDASIHLTSDARRVFAAWFNDNRDAIRAASGAVAGWRAKAPQHLARVALVLHAMGDPSGFAARPVAAATIEAAIEIIAYADAHFRMVASALRMGAGAPRGERLAKRVLRVLERTGDWVSRSAILDALRTVTAEEMTEALAELERAGLAERRMRQTATRPVEEWRAIACQPCSENSENSENLQNIREILGIRGDGETPGDSENPNPGFGIFPRPVSENSENPNLHAGAESRAVTGETGNIPNFPNLPNDINEDEDAWIL